MPVWLRRAEAPPCPAAKVHAALGSDVSFEAVDDDAEAPTLLAWNWCGDSPTTEFMRHTRCTVRVLEEDGCFYADLVTGDGP
ncbi:MAG: hypothetical protein HOW73_50095 [Polyangiaceae bacterium]|nr:hypothetical protein [Polyangiaceae bacterium]